MVLSGDTIFSLSVNDSQNDQSDKIFDSSPEIEKFIVGKYGLVEMLQQFCVTCP